MNFLKMCVDILSGKDLDFVKQKLRNWHYNIIELIIIMHLEIFLMMNSLLYKTSLKKDLIIQKSGKGNSGNCWQARLHKANE